MSERHGYLTIKETLSSVVIAFIMAFVFRGFVIEGFVIPTGSMAPTLLGKHIQFTDPDTGYGWTSGPWRYQDALRTRPIGVQEGVTPHDPMTGRQLLPEDGPLRAGDRIFVLKYLDSIHNPARWDVIVFKNPGTHENFIKRLLGLPGEQIALVDGDVFTREATRANPVDGLNAWRADDWQIARKPERVQRAMWQTVFDSTYTPENASSFRPRWRGSTPGWQGLTDAPSYRYAGSTPTTLRWADPAPPFTALTDYYPYNEGDVGAGYPNPRVFPVSDVATAFGLEAEGDVAAEAVLEARGMEFRASLTYDGATGWTAQIRLRRDATWTTLDAAAAIDLEPPGPGRVVNVEFWHADQAVWLFANGALIAGGPEDGAYALTPAQRVEAVTGRALDDVMALGGDGVTNAGPLSRSSLYRRPSLRWDFSGGPFTLHRVITKRDIHYQVHPDQQRITRGGHPDLCPRLGPDDFFVCGDNSPSSADARLWTDTNLDPWINDQIGDGSYNVGTVHRDLVIGKAFIVYFPAPHKLGGVPIPDFGRVRWIW